MTEAGSLVAPEAFSVLLFDTPAMTGPGSLVAPEVFFVLLSNIPAVWVTMGVPVGGSAVPSSSSLSPRIEGLD